MTLRWVLIAAIFAVVVAEPQTSTYAQQPKANVPSPEIGAARRVTDNAGVLSAKENERLGQMLTDYERETTHQVAIVTVASLSGESIEVFSRRVANAWGLGRKGVDNGILVVVAPTERKVRIELGRGFQPYISDSQAAEIIRSHMTPAIRQGDYYGGLERGVQQLMIEGRTLVAPSSRPADGVATSIARHQSLTAASPGAAVAGSDEDGAAAYRRGDYATALRILRPLAGQGNPSSQFNLGVMYEHGRGVGRDDAEAARWYRKAAEQGLVFAQTNLGTLYESGRGVPKDEIEAVKWYRKAAQEDAWAQYNLGSMYMRGHGVSKDYAEAARWFQKAAERGLDSAQNNLGVMYKNGQGVPQDLKAAAKWFRLSADQGDANAQANLGSMYVGGLGVPQDYVEAHKWFNLAAAHFSASKADKRGMAAEYRDLVATRMTSAQIAEAQKRANEWKPK